MLTEQTKYTYVVYPDGCIEITPQVQIFKDDPVVPYLTEKQPMQWFEPGTSTEKMPGYGKQLADMVWTKEIVEAFRVANPVDEPEPIDEVEDPEPGIAEDEES